MNKEGKSNCECDYPWRNTENQMKKGWKARLIYIDYTKAINLYEKHRCYNILSLVYRRKQKRAIAVKRRCSSLTERHLLSQSFIIDTSDEWVLY